MPSLPRLPLSRMLTGVYPMPAEMDDLHSSFVCCRFCARLNARDGIAAILYAELAVTDEEPHLVTIAVPVINGLLSQPNIGLYGPSLGPSRQLATLGAVLHPSLRACLQTHVTRCLAQPPLITVLPLNPRKDPLCP